jgi:hypothetical protein
MSRSFRDFPGWSDNNKGKKAAKRFANKKVRNTKGISNGGCYKKLYEQWNICDYNGRWYSINSFWNWCKEYHVYKDRAFKYFYKGYSK